MLSISTAVPSPQTPVSALCIFLRCSPYHKGYKCLSSTWRIYLARTVPFNEQYFPYLELFLLPSTNPPPSSTTYLLPLPPPFSHLTSPGLFSFSLSHFLSFTKCPPSVPSPHSSLVPFIPVPSPPPPPVSVTSLAPHCSIHPMTTWGKSGIVRPRLL